MSDERINYWEKVPYDGMDPNNGPDADWVEVGDFEDAIHIAYAEGKRFGRQEERDNGGTKYDT